MYRPTYGELVDKVQSEQDLQEEIFVQPKEMLYYFNEGLSRVEAIITTIYEDYYLRPKNFPLTANQQDYVLPADIYMDKIRRLIYTQANSSGYEIPRIRSLSALPYLQQYSNAFDLSYLITKPDDDDLDEDIIRFYPIPTSDVTTITMWYLRRIRRFTGVATQQIDMPAFSEVPAQYTKWRCLLKEKRAEDAQAAKQTYDEMIQEMQDTMQDKVPDENNKILQDTAFYYDFDSSVRNTGEGF